MSLGGGITNKEETNIVNTKISECTEGSDKATLFQILYFPLPKVSQDLKAQV